MSRAAPAEPHTNNTDEPVTLKTTGSGTSTFTLLPRDSGISVHGWRIHRHSGAISSTSELDAFQAASSIHCPEMSFLANHLTLEHEASGVSVCFEPKQALQACVHQATAPAQTAVPTAGTTLPGRPAASAAAAPPAKLQVAAASKWNPKSYEGLVEGGVRQVDHGFDWTYTTKYKGQVSVSGEPAASGVISTTQEEIPIGMLQRPDPILWYDTLPLYEDELHDNGVASLTVKIRVMETCFLVLMQFWLRVDEMLVRVYDTRVFHAFGTPFLMREQTIRENTFDELAKLGMPRTPSLYTNPADFSRKLTLKSTERELISLAVPPAVAAAPASSASAAAAAPHVDVVRISAEPLEPQSADLQALVGADEAGAISTFIGTTRDTFNGKQVVKLEYEAYEAMALKQLQSLCTQMRQKWPNITKCAILHRIGTVKVGESSVVIAVSSPHRREALESVSWCIDELKRRVVIWKKEWYADGSTWKENAEWREEQEKIKQQAKANALTPK